MKITNLQTWEQLITWLNQPQWSEGHQKRPRFVFRGQADSKWLLETSLKRHFDKTLSAEQSNQWRTRELKMYRLFRERLLKTFPGMYDKWPAPDIVALMQHYEAPTRFIDFSYSPQVAAWFALKTAKSTCAIWVADRLVLDKRREERGLPEYCGPTHHPEYKTFQKDVDGKYREVASILDTHEN